MKLQTFEELSDLNQDLERIERMIDATTDGPWYSYVVGRDAEATSNCIEVGSCNELGSFEAIQLVGGTIADQDFIASARQELPRLLLEVRALRAQLESLHDAEVSPPMQDHRGSDAVVGVRNNSIRALKWPSRVDVA